MRWTEEKANEWQKKTGWLFGFNYVVSTAVNSTEMSDIITYHDYNPLESSVEKINNLKKYNRPILCTEWLFREGGNTFESHLPLYKENISGAYNWGLIKGRTQTNLHWGSKLNDAEPEIWQHDLFYPDGKPYSKAEIEFIKNYQKLD